MKKIIIDTDPGLDDALAIMFACLCPEFDIKAITTVCGNSTIENTTSNARYILNFLDRNDIPLYSGAKSPVERDLVQAVVHGQDGLAGINKFGNSTLTNNAAFQIISILKKYPNQISIVVLGPLTNIAEVIKTDPDAIKLAKELVIMGGAVRVAGNKNRVAEFNIFVDPEAASIVMKNPVKKTLVPLDACNYSTMCLDDIKDLKSTLIRNLVKKIIIPYSSNILAETGQNKAIMYDPLTIYYLLESKKCVTENMNIQIETAGLITRGMTVIDDRVSSKRVKPNIKVVMKVQNKLFLNKFIEAMNRYEK